MIEALVRPDLDSTSGWAIFGMPALDPPAPTVGACSVMGWGVGFGGGEAVALPSAGVITLTSGDEMLSITPWKGGLYAGATIAQPLWQPGGAVHIAGAGDEVPGFQVTLEAPPRARITSLAPGPVTIDVAEGLTLAWVPVAGGRTIVDFDDSAATEHIRCDFDASAGTGVVPAIALAHLPPGKGTLAVSSHILAPVVEGDWTIHVDLSTSAANSDGERAVYAVTFE